MYSREEAKRIREKFWIEFNNMSASVRLLQGKPRKWLLYKTGLRGVELKFELDNKQMGVMIEITHRDVYKRLEVYEKFEQVKKILSDLYDGELTWTDEWITNEGKEVCRISEYRSGVNINRQEQWGDIMDWLEQKMLSLEDAFEEVHPFLKKEIEAVFADD